MVKKKELKFTTGFESLDDVILGLMPGDNVVWRADFIEDYQYFLKPFCKNAISEGKTVIYLRFAKHEYLLPKSVKAKVYQLNPRSGFENFISELFEIIEKHGEGACYVFDCLSGLSADWYSDRMLGNFFILTSRHLHNMKCLSYFLVLKNKHMQTAIDTVHETAEVVLNIFSSSKQRYLLPIKVQNRHSTTMYTLHSCEHNILKPVMKSATVSEILSAIQQPWIDFNIDRRDIWTRKLTEVHRAYEKIQRTGNIPKKVESLKKQLIKMMVTRDRALLKLCEKYFTIFNMICIAKRMIGSGLIGGKSVGMLLGRIILKKDNSYWQKKLETHDSFYVGSDIFTTFMIINDLWWSRRRLENAAPDFSGTDELQEKIMGGSFPEDVIEQFRELLNYFGQSPIIVRSSSLLEDAYGNSFSGKYDSVFCANQGDPEQRLQYFMDAVKEVYCSTVSKEALSYREHRGLLKKNEEMALLVQRVSGSLYGDMYFPHAAGVGYSFNPFVWNPKIDPASGVLRLVFGLGTHAVDRVVDDYTRIVSINEPMLRPEHNFDEIRRHTQKVVDVMDLRKKEQTSCKFDKVGRLIDDIPLDIFAPRDAELEKRAKEHNMKDVFSNVLTFEHLLTKSHFTKDMGNILNILSEAYGQPVDIEFSVNFLDDKHYRINLLQCRPFQIQTEFKRLKAVENLNTDDIVLRTNGPIVGQSKYKVCDRIIYVSPAKYGKMSMSDRYSVARLIGQLTNSDNRKSVALIGPGRWGSTMPALGIPVKFSEIKNASILCEVVAMHEGLTPDISLGSHFFNDLVEVKIVYMALFPKNDYSIVCEDYLKSMPNKLTELMPDAKALADSVYVIDTADTREEKKLYMRVDNLKQQGMLYFS